MRAIERRHLANQPGRVECIACGGAGAASNGSTCVPCKGSGSTYQGVRGPASAPNALLSSASTEHYTPSPIVEAARSVLGGIDLDPASCSLANEVIEAAAWYGPGGFAPDGLVEPWIGRVFCNPPGGKVPDECKGCGTKSSAALWWSVLAEAWRTGEVSAAIFVGFNLEILRSAQALDVPQPLSFPFCVPSGRIAFDNEVDGRRVPSTQPTHANVIVFLPPRQDGKASSGWKGGAVARFVEVFSPIGRCKA